MADPQQASRARDSANQGAAVAAKTLSPPPVQPLTAAPSPAPAAVSSAAQPHYFVRRFRVIGGGNLLPREEVENAVYPYMGPYRTAQDVEQARSALESAYHDKGYQTVAVQIPPQDPHSGIITLQVVPATVGRLRVHGSRFFSLEAIKEQAPSLAEGTVPNFNAVGKDIVAMNQSADLRVTPTLRPGELPHTVDVDLNVKDTFPLHGSVEVNNRYSPDTSPLRVNGSVSYDNLWQLGHSIGFSFQVSPEDLQQVKVFSGYYIARDPDISWLSVELEGTDQQSNVSTLGGIGVAGNGAVVGTKFIFTLPTEKNFYHSFTFGFDYKHFTQSIIVAGTSSPTPITYVPISASYSATWQDKKAVTQLNGNINLALRELGSSESDFSNKRYGSSGNFAYARGDISRTQNLPGDFQAYLKLQGQISDEPLPDAEEFSGGGLGTVRGYLESEALGDNAMLGSLELRSPSASSFLGKQVNEWRVYAFIDSALLAINQHLPEQDSSNELLSVGAGTRLSLLDHINGSLDMGLPLVQGPSSKVGDFLLTFRFWLEF